MGGGSDLGNSLSAIGAGQNVFRAWFFQRLATTSGSQRDWSAFDHTLAVAQAHGERVIATLGNQWGDCEEQPPVYKTESWYQSGYRASLDGLPNSYRDWVAAVVARYRNNSTIMAWQLINEAEDATSRGGWCSGSAATSLRAFTSDMASLVKSIDGNHLLSLGTIGTGQCGTAGGQYQWVHSVPGIDLCEYHDYGSAGSVLPGALQNRIDQCQAIGKPLFVGETGIQVGSVGSAENRAADFAAKFNAQFSAGVQGELVWDWVDGANVAYSGYEVGPGDPTLGLFGRY
jgi:endo-1,4-beta-mannosidase